MRVVNDFSRSMLKLAWLTLVVTHARRMVKDPGRRPWALWGVFLGFVLGSYGPSVGITTPALAPPARPPAATDRGAAR